MTRIYVEFVKPNKPLIRMTTMVDIADCRFVVVWWILVDLKIFDSVPAALVELVSTENSVCFTEVLTEY